MAIRTWRLPNGWAWCHARQLAGGRDFSGGCGWVGARCSPAWPHAGDLCADGAGRHREDHAAEALSPDALVDAHHGSGGGHQRSQRAAYLARARPEAASRAYLQTGNDPRFAEKLEDVVSLYLNPPEHALVLSLDEKSQIQALDRTQPGLPLKKGRGETMTHDYKRHGTTTLFAALNVADGVVIGTCMDRHRHQEWLKFLRLIDA